MSEFWQGFCWGVGLGIVGIIFVVWLISSALSEGIGRGLNW